MKYLEGIAIIFVVVAVVYMILKIIGQIQDNTTRQMREPTPKEIEIVSRDLRIKAENLLAMSEVYELQIVQLVYEIQNTEKELKNNTTMSELDRRLLINRSLRLQERKCIIEGKMLKIDKELAEISLEEYRRQMM